MLAECCGIRRIKHTETRCCRKIIDHRVKSDSVSSQAASHNIVIDYFPKTAHTVVLYSLPMGYDKTDIRLLHIQWR